MTDIILVQLPIQKYIQKGFKFQNEFNPALGILSLATVLQFNGYEVQIIDLFNEPISKEDFLKRMEIEKPKVVGISVYTENIAMAIAFAKLIKSKFPEIKILLGGPHVSLVDTEFKLHNCIDFIIINEGEGSIIELTEAILTNEAVIKYSDIIGIKYRKNGIVYENKSRDFIRDLDLIPIPKREFFDIIKYKNNAFINVYSSRGCPSKCIYCAAGALSGNNYRVRNIENVFLEMIMIENIIGPKCLSIIDDSFTILKNRIQHFIELIKIYKPKFSWNCESRINNMNKDLLKQMAECNCIAIQYGIESGSQEVINKIKKNINLELALELIDETIKNGIMVAVGFILGHYCDTNETMMQTINLIKDLKSRYGGQIEIAISYNTPFPGTYQYIHREELGIKLVSMDYIRYSMLEPVVYTDQFSVDDQRNWMYEARDIRFKTLNTIMEYKNKWEE